MKRRVVITGMGAMTALGEGVRPLWQALFEGRSGIRRLSLENGSERWQTLGAAVPDFSPEKFVTQRKALKVMARDIQLAVAGASLALTDAKLDGATVDRDRFGVIVGSGMLNHELEELAPSIQNSWNESGELDLERFAENGLPALFPLWLLKYLPNMSACHISIIFDLRGMNNTLTTGASAGLQAIGEAYRIIQRGDAELMLAGGSESKLNPVGLSQYQILGVLSEATGDPAASYRPFDRESKGFVVGEGCAFLALEELEHAKARKANIYAEIVGFGCASSKRQETAMKVSLEDAGVKKEAVRYVQACGLGVAEDDEREAASIESVFNGSGSGLRVSASKPATGFTGFSSGALDAVVSTLALKEQSIPPILNFKTAKKNWSFDFVKTAQSAKPTGEYALTNAFGFNGPSVSMITKVYKG